MKVVEFMLQEDDPDFVLSTKRNKPLYPGAITISFIFIGILCAVTSFSIKNGIHIPLLALAGVVLVLTALNFLIVKYGKDYIPNLWRYWLFWDFLPGRPDRLAHVLDNERRLASMLENEMSRAVMRPILEKRGRVAVNVTTDGMEVEFDKRKIKFPRADLNEIKADNRMIIFESKSGLKAFIPRRAVSSNKEWAELSELVSGKRAA